MNITRKNHQSGRENISENKSKELTNPYCIVYKLNPTPPEQLYCSFLYQV